MTKPTQFDLLATSDNATDFAKALTSIKVRGESVQMDIQKYLVAVGIRWKVTGDVRPAVARVNMLVCDLPKGFRANAIKPWVEAFFGMILVDEKDHPNDGQWVAGLRKAKDLDVEAMPKAENHWYTFTKEPEYKPLNFDDLILNALSKADARLKKGVKDVDSIDCEKMAAIRAIMKPADAAAE